MDPVTTAFILGLELAGIGAGNTAVADLGDNLDVIEAGAVSLQPWGGPSLQPFLGVRGGWGTVALAPAIAGHGGVATSSDGRQASVRTLFWNAELKSAFALGPVLLGADLGLGSGSAAVGGSVVAKSPMTVTLGPTLGMRADLPESLPVSLSVIGGARYAVRLAEGSTDHGLEGSLSLEWRPTL